MLHLRYSRLTHWNPNNNSCIVPPDPSWSTEINTVKELGYNSRRPVVRWELLWGLMMSSQPSSCWFITFSMTSKVKGNWKSHLGGHSYVYKWQQTAEKPSVVSFLDYCIFSLDLFPESTAPSHELFHKGMHLQNVVEHLHNIMHMQLGIRLHRHLRFFGWTDSDLQCLPS